MTERDAMLLSVVFGAGIVAIVVGGVVWLVGGARIGGWVLVIAMAASALGLLGELMGWWP